MFGGYTTYDITIIEFSGSDFFFIDFSIPFNTKELTWENLSGSYTLPLLAYAAAVKGGITNNTLFIYGGIVDSASPLVYRYDPPSNIWNTPNIAGINDIRKRDVVGVIDNNGKMYIWGGMEVIDGINANYVNDMLILDTMNLSWGQGSLIGAPTARGNYGAALLPNNNIIYMGGFNGKVLPFNQIYLYDTINNNWSTRTTSGIVPSGRDGFSAIPGLDSQRIIIFGGNSTVTGYNLTIEDSLYEVNLINFEWSIPKISGQIPKSRMYHRANVIGKYMVVSFGYGYDSSIESDILLLDISNINEYIWTYNFDSSYNSVSSSSPSQSTEQSSPTQPSSPTHTVNLLSALQSEKSSLSLIGAIVGSLFGSVLLLFGGFFIYKWSKIEREPKDSMMISENNDDSNNNSQERMLNTTNINDNETISINDL
ncbi:hypothetical protein RclHR1_03590006 [Rhizophagus clarus]|nr:hypothetical protein RclHR1_03590006 [Rhizophagus clarus]